MKRWAFTYDRKAKVYVFENIKDLPTSELSNLFFLNIDNTELTLGGGPDGICLCLPNTKDILWQMNDIYLKVLSLYDPIKYAIMMDTDKEQAIFKSALFKLTDQSPYEIKGLGNYMP